MSEISVIIPVYNVENYLNQCLDSICNQTFRDIEIICVNDGSTDNSLDILNDYEKKDKRVKIISQTNRGLGASRNIGLNNSTGNYILFIDSDDYIELDTLEKLYNNAISNDSDIVLFKYQKVDEFNNILQRNLNFKIDDNFGNIDYNNFTFTYKDVKNHVMNSSFSACLKLYKKEFIDNIDLVFSDSLNFEDVPVHVKVMIEAKKISFVPESLYNYRYNPNSITNFTADTFDIFKIIDLTEIYLKENNYYDELENEFIFFKIVQISQYLKNGASNSYFKKAKSEFEKITIKDKKTIKKYALDKYYLVLSCDDYNEYVKKSNVKSNDNFFNKLINILKF